MSNINFEFLNSIAPVELPEVEAKPKGKVKQERNPEGMKIRVFKSGEVYPSAQLVEEFGLEYKHRDSEEVSYGFDLINSHSWSQYPSTEGTPQFVFLAAVEKSLPKVSLFGSVDFDSEGNPKKSVLNQGSKRPELIEMLREVYNKHIVEACHPNGEVISSLDTLFGSKNYVDLEVKVDVKVFENLPKVYVPKLVTRGEDKGKSTYILRDSLVINPLVIVQEEVNEEIN